MKHLLSIEKLGSGLRSSPVSLREGSRADHLREVPRRPCRCRRRWVLPRVTRRVARTPDRRPIREVALRARDAAAAPLAVQAEIIEQAGRREGDDRPPMLDIHRERLRRARLPEGHHHRPQGLAPRDRPRPARTLRSCWPPRVPDLHVRTEGPAADLKMLGRLGF